MALFKVTVKSSILVGGSGGKRFKRIEAGMTAEVSYNGSTLSFSHPTVREEILRQFKVKYDIDFPTVHMHSGYLKAEKL